MKDKYISEMKKITDTFKEEEEKKETELKNLKIKSQFKCIFKKDVLCLQLFGRP